MKLDLLLEGIEVLERGGATGEADVSSVGFDSRKVGRGDAFFALSGTQVDGHEFVDAVTAAGVAVVVVERMPQNIDPRVVYIRVADTHAALGIAAANFYDNPTRKLLLVGVTGTNGKTTTATLLYNLFERLGYKSGLISTIVCRVHEQSYPATHTTPDAVALNRLFADMVACGCQYAFMEVSSHSLAQRRIEGLHFAGALFTNITHDHLDYHGTFANYITAKKMLFDSLPSDAFAIYNGDDRNGRVMVQNCRARVKSFALSSGADFRCHIEEMLIDGMLLQIDSHQVWVKLTGRFNAYNMLGIYAAARMLGADCDEVLTALSTLDSAAGRFEVIRSRQGITAVVDYAHTPDALENVMQTVNEVRSGRGRLIVVVGCGGDRDRTKRPEMGEIAARLSDLAIFTSDNPRSEDPDQILQQITAGVPASRRYLTITRREEAIRAAVMTAGADDIILIAGKGHEDYQIVGSERHHFDDREQVRKCFAALDAGDASHNREEADSINN